MPYIALMKSTAGTLLERISALAAQRDEKYPFLREPRACGRLVDREIEDIVIDQFGECLWVYWYPETAPSERDLADIATFSATRNKEWMARWMKDRGKDPNTKVSWSSSLFPSSWVAREGSLRFVFRADGGLSPGLFLDQRLNRERIMELAKGHSVLNLFSYTGGFTVAALAGGARQVTSVDVSKKYLDWTRANILENNLDVAVSRSIPDDAVRFVSRAKRRGEKYDLIICDPPTFSRTGSRVFRAPTDFAPLVADLSLILEENGVLFCSSNTDTWPNDLFHRDIVAALPKETFTILPDTEALSDFSALPSAQKLKTLWAKKKTS
jgi:23S rRNA (cytosine1962-C5)-methyltransferase